MDYDKQPWGRAIPYTSPTGRKTTLYNIGVVAEAIGRTSQTIRKWEVSGVIPPTPFKQGDKRLYSKEHIDAMVHWAEVSNIKMGSRITQSRFARHMHKEFKRLNDYFFKKEEDSDGTKKEE